jgi:glycosyltransferase involved in cell wall biosynthesis
MSMLSLVIPVYKNEENLPRLLESIGNVSRQLPLPLEVVFVVDGSPDRSFEILRDSLAAVPFRSQLVNLSRNFGSFSAIRAGLQAGTGDYFAVLAADLQEPPELLLQFAEVLVADRADIVFGCRDRRSDPKGSELLSTLFWHLYRTFVIPDMPRGGIDVFACNRQVRDRVLQLREVNTNLIALLFWLGFRRHFVLYDRQKRQEGKSAWTFRKKLAYSLDSIFNFTDLPIRVLLFVGVLGMLSSLVFGTVVLIAKMRGMVSVPGYTPIVLTIMFFGGLTSLGFGIIGQYLWLSLQNARQRPAFIVSSAEEFPPAIRSAQPAQRESLREH